MTPSAQLPVGGQRTPLSGHNTWILICTYARNEQLGRLLDSLRRAAMPADSQVQFPQLIIVDNAEAAQARSLVRQRYPEARYLHQPQPGIATARNTSLGALPDEAAAAIFIDDDEQVSAGWFTALLECANASGADAVTGPVQPVFSGEEPEWLHSYGYVRRTDFTTGPHQRRLATNNTLVRTAWFTEHRFRFDEAFNFTGGSDSDLFERMMAAGAQYWWCAEALVTEEVPASRASREWLRTRALRGGKVRALKHRRRATTGQARVSARILAEGTARAGYGSLRRAAAQLRRRAVTYTDDYYLCEGLGMLLSFTGRGHDEYARSS